jgi:hypothetical protein
MREKIDYAPLPVQRTSQCSEPRVKNRGELLAMMRTGKLSGAVKAGWMLRLRRVIVQRLAHANVAQRFQKQPRHPASASAGCAAHHSHSIVAGGLPEMS